MSKENSDILQKDDLSRLESLARKATFSLGFGIIAGILAYEFISISEQLLIPFSTGVFIVTARLGQILDSIADKFLSKNEANLDSEQIYEYLKGQKNAKSKKENFRPDIEIEDESIRKNSEELRNTDSRLSTQ